MTTTRVQGRKEYMQLIFHTQHMTTCVVSECKCRLGLTIAGVLGRKEYM